MSSYHLRTIAQRSFATSARHAGKAAAAAAIARRVSAAPHIGIVPIVRPFAGFTTGAVAPSSASRQPPST